MTLLARKKGWDREAVADAVAEALDIADTQFDQLRRRIAAALVK